jgi:hypothetical protein
MNSYCCFDHALCDVELPGVLGADARWSVSMLAPGVEAGETPRWCGRQVGGSGAIVVDDTGRVVA